MSRWQLEPPQIVGHEIVAPDALVLQIRKPPGALTGAITRYRGERRLVSRSQTAAADCSSIRRLRNRRRADETLRERKHDAPRAARPSTRRRLRTAVCWLFAAAKVGRNSSFSIESGSRVKFGRRSAAYQRVTLSSEAKAAAAALFRLLQVGESRRSTSVSRAPRRSCIGSPTGQTRRSPRL